MISRFLGLFTKGKKVDVPYIEPEICDPVDLLKTWSECARLSMNTECLGNEEQAEQVLDTVRSYALYNPLSFEELSVCYNALGKWRQLQSQISGIKENELTSNFIPQVLNEDFHRINQADLSDEQKAEKRSFYQTLFMAYAVNAYRPGNVTSEKMSEVKNLPERLETDILPDIPHKQLIRQMHGRALGFHQQEQELLSGGFVELNALQSLRIAYRIQNEELLPDFAKSIFSDNRPVLRQDKVQEPIPEYL